MICALGDRRAGETAKLIGRNKRSGTSGLLISGSKVRALVRPPNFSSLISTLDRSTGPLAYSPCKFRLIHTQLTRQVRYRAYGSNLIRRQQALLWKPATNSLITAWLEFRVLPGPPLQKNDIERIEFFHADYVLLQLLF
jgi:hypothetical protein